MTKCEICGAELRRPYWVAKRYKVSLAELVSPTSADPLTGTRVATCGARTCVETARTG